MVAVFGLTIIAALQGDSFTKTMYAGLFGILLGTIGMTAGGVQRGTFDMVSLMDGIPLIPALIGLFAVSELFLLADKGYIGSKASRKQNDSIEILNGIKSTLKYPFNILRSSAIGVFIGAIPAAGSSIASLISYNEARRASKRKKRSLEKEVKKALLRLNQRTTLQKAAHWPRCLFLVSLGVPQQPCCLVQLLCKAGCPGRVYLSITATFSTESFFFRSHSRSTIINYGSCILYSGRENYKNPNECVDPDRCRLYYTRFFRLAKLNV